MSSLPRVTAKTRERVSQEFDDQGPIACTASIVDFLRRSNPELLDIVSKCANDLDNSAKVMAGFAMFYRLLILELSLSHGGTELNQLPCVAPETRDLLVKRIDQLGPETFAIRTIEHLERSNPELLKMADNFASKHSDYLRVMQGFALLYQTLVLQMSLDRGRLH